MPDTKWHSVSVDWVSGLPPTTRGHDAIMTVVDRFSKRGMFIACRKDMTADDLIYVFLREVVRLKGCPRQIVSDRDKLFESQAWKELAQRFKIEMHQMVANRPRGLNTRTVRDRYPLPSIQSILSTLGGSTVFSKIDLVSGFQQIRVQDKDIEKAGLTTQFGAFEWVVMPDAHAPFTICFLHQQATCSVWTRGWSDPTRSMQLVQLSSKII